MRRKDARDVYTVNAPPVLSMVLNPNGTIEFLAEIYESARRYHLFINLESVATLTPDAVAVMIATLQEDLVTRSTRVRGNYPLDEQAAAILAQSGFGEHVSLRAREGMPLKGTIKKVDHRGSRRIESETAKDLVDFALDGDPARRESLKPTYGFLLECMANTWEHAGTVRVRGTPGARHAKNWWATAFRHTDLGKSSFTFVDLGVGIFRSVELRRRLQAWLQKVGLLPDKEILRKLLRREIPSSTGLEYRGRGLPSIYEAAKEGRIRKLVIVANGACGDIETEEYTNLTTPFQGTFVYWEVPDAGT
jgi:hypothetical protein